MTDRIFTPYANPSTNVRVRTILSEADLAKIERGSRWGPHRFTDLTTGAVFEAQGADCGAGRCFCAAEITRIIEPGERPLETFV